MYNRSVMKKVLTGIVITMMLAACAEEREPIKPAADINAGKTIAADNCSSCHGLDGHGKTSEIPNLAAQPARYLVDAMHAYREGRRHHAALQELISGFSETDIRNIAGYFSSLPPVNPGPVISQDASAYQEGKEVASTCTVCHGDDGISNSPGTPSLAGQQPAYLMVATQEYANGSRGHVEKVEMLQGLDEVDIEKMAMYFAAPVTEVAEPTPVRRCADR